MEIVASQFLTWQRSCDPWAQQRSPPVPLKSLVPKWYKNLKGNLKEYLPEGFDLNQTARHCLGLRGALNIGWTIPWEFGDIRGRELHPEQLHSSIWASKTGDHYDWSIWLKAWPWRAKLPKGWRLYITAHPLIWTHDYFCFTGCVDANYMLTDQATIGSMWRYDYELDPEYNYFNLEVVIAMRRGFGFDSIEKGTPIFSAIPVYDPDYIPRYNQTYS